MLQDLLGTFQEECKVAASLNQPVVLMVFGHGSLDTYGVAIGGRGNPIKAPRLQVKHIIASLRGLDVSLTILLTSCYSGGWVLQLQLNISTLTAAGRGVQSLSWPSSIGGRYHGLVYAIAVREAFIKMEDENVTQFHPHPSGQELDGELQSSSYAELTNVIHSTLLNDVDRLGDRHEIQFSAKDDMWEQEWRQRSRFPLSTFKSRWDELPRMPIQDFLSLRPGRTGAIEAGSTSMEVETRSYGLHCKFNRRQAITAIKDLAYGYLNSFPPPDNSSTDRGCNGDARALLEKDKFPSWKLEGLQAALQYSMDSMRLASAYKNLIGLKFADCDKFDFELWQTSMLASARSTKNSEDKWNKYKAYGDEITQPPIFDASTPSQGWHFNKPSFYLAAAFVECNLSPDAVSEAIKVILTEKNVRVRALTLRVRMDHSVRLAGSRVFESLGKKMRPLSSRGPIPNFAEVLDV